MEFIYIALFLGWSYLCYYIGKRLQRAEADVKRLDDIHRIDGVISNASSAFDRMYKEKHK